MSPAALVWSLLTSRLAGPVGAAAALLMAVLLLATCAAKATLSGQAEGLAAERDRWRRSAQDWRKAMTAAEALRATETDAARRAVEEAGAACEARVAAARRSARAIENIVNQEVSRDPNGCPARGLVPAERLRDALVPDA